MTIDDYLVLINRLATAWREYVSLDHHKTRDYYWYFQVVYSGDGEPQYRALHDGYVAHMVEARPLRDTVEQAQQDMLDMLVEAFTDQLEWADRVLNGPEDWDVLQIEQAKLAVYSFPPLIEEVKELNK